MLCSVLASGEVVNKPDTLQAQQFALMLQAGLPASEAIQYFTESDDPVELGEMLKSWARSSTVKRAQVALLGKSWTDMSLDEMIQHGLHHHYAQLAYLLYSHHYGEVSVADKSKLDTARASLEAKQAGNAGKTDALSRFYDDITSGKLKLPGRTRLN